MEAIILVGGQGTRLRPVVSDRPKALAPVDGKPFIQLLLARLAAKGFNRVVLATGYMGNQIVRAVGGSLFGMEIVYSHETVPLGTGGALAKAMDMVSEGCAMAMNGDTWLDMDFAGAYSLWQKTGRIVMAGFYMNDVSRYGKLVISGAHVVRLGEKDSTGAGWINAGCYILPRDIFEDCPFAGAFSFEKDFLSMYLAQRPAPLFRARGAFHDIGVPDDYRNFERFWKRTNSLGES